MKLRPATFALPAALALSACSSQEPAPLDARTVALTAERNFRHVAVELAEAGAFLAESRTLAGLLGGGRDCADDGEEGCEPALDLDLRQASAAFAELLQSRIFTEANVESNEGGQIVFRLRPEVVCAPLDADCLELLGRVPVRLAVSSDAPGDLDVEVRIGEPALVPVQLALHAEDLQIIADLAAVQRSAEQIAEAPGEVELAGRVGVALTRDGAGRFTASLSVLEPVAVIGPFELRVGRAVPALSATVDEGRRSLRVAAGLAALDLRAPVELFDDAADGGTLRLHLGGLSGSTTLSAQRDGDELRLAGFGLGDETTVIELDGARLAAIDLNPESGRTLDLSAVVDDRGATLQVSPGLDLRIALDLASAASRFEVPDWALAERLGIRLDGDAAPRIRLGEAPPVAGLAVGPTELARQIAGSLHLTSERLPAVEVAAGMCLVEGEPDASWPDHPFSGLAAASCR